MGNAICGCDDIPKETDHDTYTKEVNQKYDQKIKDDSNHNISFDHDETQNKSYVIKC